MDAVSTRSTAPAGTWKPGQLCHSLADVRAAAEVLFSGPPPPLSEAQVRAVLPAYARVIAARKRREEEAAGAA